MEIKVIVQNIKENKCRLQVQLNMLYKATWLITGIFSSETYQTNQFIN